MSDAVAMISPASFWVPEYICLSAWTEHAPFAFWISDALRPRCFVELGTHYGYSYFAFCQAIDRLGLGTTAYAVDTWKGDEHAGFYDETVYQSVAKRNTKKYSAFSCLMRTTFEDALGCFSDGSVDLLHIDGRHFYDDIKHDFAMWHRKLTKDAVVLFHDTNVREREFGVWRFFDEVAALHPSFQFYHGHGLGLVTVGDCMPEPLAPLLQASLETADQIRAVYAALGGALTPRRALSIKSDEIALLLNEETGASSVDAESVAQISEWDSQVQKLRTTLEARGSVIGELRVEVQHRAATETALRAEVEQHAASEAALRAEVEQHAAIEAALRADIEQRAATEAALHVEIERVAEILRSTVAERDAREHAAAEVLQGEIASLRSQLAVSERDLRERTTAVDALRGEIRSSRIQLAAAEREARERGTAAEMLQGEITSLRSERDAARDVGRAALASLRTPPAPIPEVPQNAGWVMVVLRRLGLRSSYPIAASPVIADG